MFFGSSDENEEEGFLRPPPSPSSAVSGSDLFQMNAKDHLVGSASRFLHSKTFACFYFIFVVLNVIAIIWTIVLKYPTGVLYMLLELVLLLALMAEVSINFCAQGHRFWTHRSNVFDVAVVGACTLAFVSYTQGFSASEEVEEVAAYSLLVFRNTMQGFRLYLRLKSRQYSLTKPISDISIARSPRDIVHDLPLPP